MLPSESKAMSCGVGTVMVNACKFLASLALFSVTVPPPTIVMMTPVVRSTRRMRLLPESAM